MESYNLKKQVDRDRLRANRKAELEAIKNGTWPRDINDVFRWSPPYHSSSFDYAAKMCQHELHSLDDLERRIRAGLIQGFEL